MLITLASWVTGLGLEWLALQTVPPGHSSLTDLPQCALLILLSLYPVTAFLGHSAFEQGQIHPTAYFYIAHTQLMVFTFLIGWGG